MNMNKVSNYRALSLTAVSVLILNCSLAQANGSGALKLLPYQKSEPSFMMVESSALVPLSTAVWPLKMIHADKAHQLQQKGAGVRVCVIDSGIDEDHPALRGAVAEGMNFVDGRLSDLSDRGGHGTLISTLIAGRQTSDFVGVAPEAQLVVAKVIDKNGTTTVEILEKAVEYCMTRSQVINMSLGGNIISKNISDLLTEARRNGISVVAAAGNTGNELMFPANDDSVFAVGAINVISNAPVWSPTSYKLNYVAPGADVPVLMKNLSIEYYSGTSMAAAYVSGAEAIRIAAAKAELEVQYLSIPQNRQGRGLIDLEKTLLK
jgi:subtilisin family serine protease